MVVTTSQIFAIVLSVLLLSNPAGVPGDEQAVLIYIPLRDSDITKLQSLEEKLRIAIEKAHVGEVDGNEIGDGLYTIYTYGPDAQKIFKVAEPILKEFRPPSGSYALV